MQLFVEYNQVLNPLDPDSLRRMVRAVAMPPLFTWIGYGQGLTEQDLRAYKSKLEMQFAEISLVNGLRPLPAAPAGVVYLGYGPLKDWVLWSNVSIGILREAWGSAAYYGIFYSIDAYRDDVQWAYHAYFQGPGGMGSRVLQRSVGMDGFPAEDCETRYEAS